MSVAVPPNPPESWLELPDGKTFWLKGRCVIGRQPENELALELPALSRRHALIVAEGRGYAISDLHSRNGTYVNGSAVTRPVVLRDGDEIRLGAIPLRFRCKRPWFGSNAALPHSTLTQRLDQIEERPCWLLLIDLATNPEPEVPVSRETVLRETQAWITELRPLIENHGGRINGYLAEAVFAFWICDRADPERILTTLRAIEAWRPRSPLAFRVVVHHGNVLFSRSDRGEELSGTEVNFLTQAAKVARSFSAPALVSPTALKSLALEGRCECFGRAGVNGMKDFFSFYGLPREFITPPPDAA